MDLIIGRHITPKDDKEFYKICSSLNSFTGAMRLFGKISGDFYEAILLINKGKIIAATCENLEKAELYLGENAIKKIREEFVKSAGRLDLYQLSEEELEKIKKENFRAILKEIPIESLGMKIKPISSRVIKEEKSGERNFFGTISFQEPMEKKAKEESIGKHLEEVRNEIEKGGISSDSLVGLHISEREIPKIFEGISSISSEKKQSLLEKLRKRRWVIDQEIAQRLSKFWSEPKTPLEKKTEGKVKTKIDELYDLVKKNKIVKLNDSLAKKLNVSKAQIESWAVILEEHNLIELHYPAIGEPEMRIIEKKD
ncbi:MAG: DUF2226 domain-containing protein [Candidatus Altiarchaeota archaeon]